MREYHFIFDTDWAKDMEVTIKANSEEEAFELLHFWHPIILKVKGTVS